MHNLETERLRFRCWTEDDWPLLAAYFEDPEQVRYVGGVKSKEASWRLLATYVGHYQLKGYGYMALEEKSSCQLVGTVGLWNSTPWPEMELGYWLLKEAQGQGFAVEAATEAQKYAWEVLKAPTFVSYIDPDNHASRRVAEKLGGIIEQTIDLLDFGPHLVYRYAKTQ